MFFLKPFLRITILSIILASLLIFLGVKYHWGDTLKKSKDTPLSLTLTQQNKNIPDETKPKSISAYDLVIVQNDKKNTLLESMNKEQITEHCVNLLSKQLKDPLSLELATVNCVVSNYQETFQNEEKIVNKLGELNQQKLLITKQCHQEFDNSNQYSNIDMQLLIGICISDKQNQN